jgi:TFIIF-interacting CTD phosphatase-like protein
VIQHCKSVYESMFLINKITQQMKDKVQLKIQEKRLTLNPKPLEKKHFKTLFIDLDETLIHSSITSSEGFCFKLNVGNYEVMSCLN